MSPTGDPIFNPSWVQQAAHKWTKHKTVVAADDISVVMRADEVKPPVQFVCDGCGQSILERGIIVPKDGTCFCGVDCETKHQFDKLEGELGGDMGSPGK